MNRRNEEILEQAKRLLERTGCQIPVVVLLALVEQEAHRQDGALSNTGRGLLYVRGQRERRYGNTKRGIEATLLGGIALLKALLEESGGDVALAVSRFPARASERRVPAGYTRLVAQRITNGEVARDFGADFDPLLLRLEERLIVAALASFSDAPPRAAPPAPDPPHEARESGPAS